jgi:hypothetical protein
VAERDGRAHGDGVAAEQAQLHAGQALGHAVAHGRHAARHLHGGAQTRRRGANLRRVALVGLVRAEHVVVGADDTQVRHTLLDDAQFVAGRQGGEGVRDVGTSHAIAAALALAQPGQTLEVGLARGAAARLDACGDGLQDGVQRGNGGGSHGM